jgi:hypothetical protein
MALPTRRGGRPRYVALGLKRTPQSKLREAAEDLDPLSLSVVPAGAAPAEAR